MSPLDSIPARKLVAVTPSDDTIVGCRAIYVGVAGNLSIIAADDTAAVTVSNVPAGTVLPIQAKKIMAATTASGIVAFL